MLLCGSTQSLYFVSVGGRVLQRVHSSSTRKHNTNAQAQSQFQATAHYQRSHYNPTHTDTEIEYKLSSKVEYKEAQSRPQSPYALYYSVHKESVKRRAREYYVANRARVLARIKHYRASNKTTIAQKDSRYRLANQELYRQYRAQNKDKLLAAYKKYYVNNREKILEKKRLKRRGLEASQIAYLSTNQPISNKVDTAPATSIDKRITYLVKNKEKNVLEADLGILHPNDWYNITRKDIKSKNEELDEFVKYLNFWTVLRILYPSMKWNLAKLQIKPKLFWRDQQDLRKFLTDLEPLLYIEEKEDWVRVSLDQFKEKAGKGLLNAFGNMYTLFSSAFPEYPWDPVKFSQRLGKNSSQRMVLVRARGIFLGLDVREEFQHPSLTWSNKSSEKLTFDVWVGDQHLALEYQGEHHYSRISSRQDLDIVSQRDRLKKLKCNENEIHLVAVPYWWDQKEETLRRLIEEGVNPNYS